MKMAKKQNEIKQAISSLENQKQKILSEKKNAPKELLSKEKEIQEIRQKLYKIEKEQEQLKSELSKLKSELPKPKFSLFKNLICRDKQRAQQRPKEKEKAIDYLKQGSGMQIKGWKRNNILKSKINELGLGRISKEKRGS